MTFMGAKLLRESLANQQQQQEPSSHQGESGEGAAYKEASVEDPVHFAVLENQLQQQAYYLAALTGQFGLGMDQEQKRKVEAGYVSLNDNYTACSSVYGGGAGSLPASESGKASTSSSSANSASPSEAMGGGELRPAKIGRMVSAAASAAAASLGGKATTVSGGYPPGPGGRLIISPFSSASWTRTATLWARVMAGIMEMVVPPMGMEMGTSSPL